MAAPLGWLLVRQRSPAAQCRPKPFEERVLCYQDRLSPGPSIAKRCPKGDLACTLAAGAVLSPWSTQERLKACAGFQGLARRYCLEGATRERGRL